MIKDKRIRRHTLKTESLGGWVYVINIKTLPSGGGIYMPYVVTHTRENPVADIQLING
jgi:hypothetical protein